MRIKSSFHDYYDSIQSYFQNSGLLYLREQKEFTFERYNQFLGRETDKESFFQEYLKYVGQDATIIGFCGEFIPVVLHIQRFGDYRPSKYHFAYNIEEQDKLIHQFGWASEIKEYEKPSGLFNYHSRNAYKILFEEVPKQASKFENLFLQYNSPILTINRGDQHIKLTTNACLKNYGFARVKPPYESYQAIYQWFSNKASPEKPIPQTLTDEEMAEIKGFNKHSFRMDSPGSKRKKFK